MLDLQYLFLFIKFCELKFINESYISTATLLIIVLLSMLTLFLLMNNKVLYANNSIAEQFYLICTILKQDFMFLVFTSVFILNLRYFLINDIMLSNGLLSYIFINFSLIIPIIIIKNIINKVIFLAIMYEHNIYMIYALILVKLLNINYYKIGYKDVCRFNIISIFISPTFMFIFNFYEFMLDFNVRYNNNSFINKYIAYSYDDIVYPLGNRFDNSIVGRLNTTLAKTLQDLQLGNAISLLTAVSDDDGEVTYTPYSRFLYNGIKYFRVSENLYYKESYLKFIFTLNIYKPGFLHRQFIQYKFYDVNIINNHYMNTGVDSAYKGFIKSTQFNNPRSTKSKQFESFVYEYVMTLSTHYFYSRDGYSYAP